MQQPLFSILISTKNRKSELQLTLDSLKKERNNPAVECLVYDDGSTDGTSQMIRQNFPEVRLYRNEISKGYLHCRNFMLNQTKALYAVSLDDDAHFLSENPLEAIAGYFGENPKCGLIAFRIFWGTQPPNSTITSQKNERVKGFVGCGHAWRMDAWQRIPHYPEWFVFYGEEEFAAYQLFKKNIEIHYLPNVLVHHRVDVTSRKSNQDYRLRQRRSLRSGWYLYFLFFPKHLIPKRLFYTLWMQLKNKTFKGDLKATLAILQAVTDVFVNLPKLLSQSNRLSSAEYEKYTQLTDSKIYWKPNDEN